MTDIRQALEEAFKVIHPEPPYSWKPLPIEHVSTDPAVKAHRYWLYNVQGRFYRFLDAEAWTDAAMMLIDRARWRILSLHETEVDGEPPFEIRMGQRDAGFGRAKVIYGTGDSEAHALIAACLKAKEQADG